MDVLLNSLAETELSLARETEPERLAGLDEDELVELHTRIRRARNKHVKVYRRQAAARVEEAGGRGKAYPKNSRSRAKAEVFEDGLARVSERLAAAARASAAALRAERLAEAQRPGNPMPPGPPAGPTVQRRAPQRLDRRPDHAGIPKQHASTRADGARRQGRRDSR
jgi:hypothetical protein